MKILMITMSMDVGGAETHILELSRELTRQGHNITVISNGGLFVRELEEAGVRHITLPFHSKNPLSVIKAKKGLEKLLDEEEFDVVHSHARIPSFICSLVSRHRAFRFVTSAHLNFSVNPLWRLMSHWGQCSMAVSDDIAEYLVKEYGYPRDKISVTINGIDTNKFSPDIPYEEALDEFGLPHGEDRQRLVYMSRLDADRADPAFRIINIAERLNEKIDNLDIVIVGAGTEYEKLCSMAAAVNGRVGRQLVTMTGGRSDTNKFIAAADVFVGVSRSALEAMAAVKPVVVAGNQGSIGIFREEVLAPAMDTNFCCRGFAVATEDDLYRDITALFSKTEEERREIGEWCHSVIMKYYTVKRMADDYIAMYERAVASPKPFHGHADVIFSGYYGFGNMGDDSILETVSEQLAVRKPDIKIAVLSRHPKTDNKKYGLKCISRTDIIGILREMRHAKLLISGGGSLFQDSTSSKSIKYYCYIIRLAHFMKLKTYIFANGVGNIYKDSNRKLTRKTVMLADRVTMRDEESAEKLVAIGVPTEKILLTTDPAFMIPPYGDEDCAHMAKRLGLMEGEKYFAVSLRRFEGAQKRAYDEKELLRETVNACAHTAKKYSIKPLFVVMQPVFDTEISNMAADMLKTEYGVDSLVISPSSGRELFSILRGSKSVSGVEFVCGMRLHILIYACSASIPVIGLSLDPKIDSLIRGIDEKCLLTVPGVKSENITGIFDSILDNRDSYSDNISAKVAPLCQLAEEEINAASKLLADK